MSMSYVTEAQGQTRTEDIAELVGSTTLPAFEFDTHILGHSSELVCYQC